MNETTDKLITVKELAEILSVVERTIYRLIESNKIPFYRIGSDGEYRFSKEAVLSALSSNTVTD